MNGNIRQGLKSDEDIEYLYDKLDFEEVLESLGIEISHHLGPWIMCHCPNTTNHSNGDQNPSFGFNVESMTYNCFVCGGGSLLKLVQEHKEYTKEEAVEWLQQMSSFALQTNDDFVAKVKKILYPVHTEPIQSVFPDESYNFPLDNDFALTWLKSRGLSDKVIQESDIGFDPKHYGITIPHRFAGSLRGWQTRHLLQENGVFYCDTCGGTAPKYTSTNHFPKKDTLFNYDVATDASVIVVESPMSCLNLLSNGIMSVATFGSFSLQQASLLHKYIRVAFWPDNDPAGYKNLMIAVESLKHSVDLRIIPVVDAAKGDAGDLTFTEQLDYITSSFSPALLPLFKGKLPTLEEAKAITNSRRK